MKKSKEERQREKLAALLGIEAPKTDSRVVAQEKSMEAEAALEYYEHPRSFTEKDCKTCNRTFATRGAPVAYCSDHCRAKAFEERMGVKWQPFRDPKDRWGFLGEPLTVPPEALAVVKHAMAMQAEQAERTEAPEETEIDAPEEVDVLALLEGLGL